MIGEVLPKGYRFDIDPNGVARAVLGKSTWAVLALTLDIELFTQLHYRQSIDPDAELSALFKDVFLYHWREECQHAILDELEWVRHDAKLTVSSATARSTNSLRWSARWMASCRRRPRPTPATSSRLAAVRLAMPRCGRSRPRSSMLTAGNTSIRAQGTLNSARC